MKKMTSAYANKMLRKLNDDKEYWLNKEKEGKTYIAAIDEEPVVSDYSYEEVSKEINDIDEKIIRIKHAINLFNCTNEITVGNTKMSIDAVLVKMAQYNKRKMILDEMRKKEPKMRVKSDFYSARKASPEYQYINYDLDVVKKEYEEIDAAIATMQMSLDKLNQTVEFEVDV